MMFGENYRMAMASVRSRRARSFLTLLGIIVGVVSVVTIFSLGEGVKRQVLGEAKRLGGDVLTVKPGSVPASGLPLDSFGGGANRPSSGSISDQDMQSVGKIKGVKSTAPLTIISGVPSRDDTSYAGAIVVGTNSQMPELANVNVEFGTFFSSDEIDKKLAIIGPKVAEKLFEEPIPIGKNFKLRDQDFVVRGVLEERQTGLLGAELDFNNAIIIPFETAKILSGGTDNIYEVLVRISNSQDSDDMANKVTEVIKQNHGNQQDFSVIKPGDSLLLANSVVRLVANLVGALAVISMLIGGISIMNIMLVSVTERTHEIGIRKAVGATNRQIRMQFMMESVVLSMWGAVLGLICAGLINLLIRIVSDFQPIVTWQPVVASILFSVSLGILFGTAPAIKASLKDPIEALRSGE